MEEWNPNQGHTARLGRVNVSWDGVNETIPEGVFDAASQDLDDLMIRLREQKCVILRTLMIFESPAR